MSLAKFNKRKFIALLGEWSSHTVYRPAYIASQLATCGLEVQVSEDTKTLLVESSPVTLCDPEWGEPGISPLSILAIVYELTIGSMPKSEMIGRDFWYRDVTSQLVEKWGLEQLGA